jgi:hypothetical protein
VPRACRPGPRRGRRRGGRAAPRPRHGWRSPRGGPRRARPRGSCRRGGRAAPTGPWWREGGGELERREVGIRRGVARSVLLDVHEAGGVGRGQRRGQRGGEALAVGARTPARARRRRGLGSPILSLNANAAAIWASVASRSAASASSAAKTAARPASASPHAPGVGRSRRGRARRRSEARRWSRHARPSRCTRASPAAQSSHVHCPLGGGPRRRHAAQRARARGCRRPIGGPRRRRPCRPGEQTPTVQASQARTGGQRQVRAVEVAEAVARLRVEIGRGEPVGAVASFGVKSGAWTMPVSGPWRRSAKAPCVTTGPRACR